MKHPTLGLDVSSSSAHACLLLPDGTTPVNRSFPATPQGLADLLAQLPAATQVYLESTGRHHLFWTRGLTAAAASAGLGGGGHRVHVLNALLAKRLQTAANALRQTKTDPADALQLARIGQLHGPELARFLWTEAPASEALKTHCRIRWAQRQQLSDTLRATQDLVGRLLPEACRLIVLSHHQGWTSLLLAVKSLKHLRGLRLGTLERHVGHAHAQTLQALLRGPLTAEKLFDLLLPSLHCQLRLIVHLRAEQERLDEIIEEACSSAGLTQHVKLARSIPAIGPKTAPILVSALPADLHAFGPKRRAMSKILALWGCEPKVRESGQWKGRRKMSKKGDRLARTALYQAASMAVMHDPGLKEVYNRQKALGKSHAVALSHLMRHLLRRLVAVLYDGKDFIKVERPTPTQN